MFFRVLLVATNALAAAALCSAGAGNLRLPTSGAAATVDGKSYLLGAERVFLRCGGLHYFRIASAAPTRGVAEPQGPALAWRDRLLQTRLAGFNMIETPVPWSLHEPARGDLRFDGPADLPRFLDLCHEMRLLVLLRIGPYVNAAVSAGGLPAWLGQDPKLLIRSNNERYIEAVRQYWAKLFPAIVERQVPRGAVAMLQIEDHYGGPDDRHLARLYDDAKDRGVRVPIVLSELNPCKDFQRFQPADAAFFATTELLPAGPVAWGERRGSFTGLADILFEGIAKGLDAYNHSMWAAGTNFALLPASGFPTRYEAPTSGLLEAGGPSPLLAEAKRANWFARAFEQVLTQATALAHHPLLEAGRRAGLVADGRTDGHTALLFFKRRYGEGRLALHDAATGQSAVLPVNSRELRHVVLGFPLSPKTTLALSTAQVFALAALGQRQALVVYAPQGCEAVMVFRCPAQPAIRAGDEALKWDEKARQLVLRWTPASAGERRDFAFDADVAIHVIALEESQVAQAWVLDGAVPVPSVTDGPRPSVADGILIGTDWLGEWTRGDKMDVELRVPARRVRQAITFYPSGPQQGVGKALGVGDVKFDPAARRIDFRLDLEALEPLTVFLRKWEMADAAERAAVGYDDAAWRETLRPEPMGDDHHGWYRCRLKAPRAGTRRLVFENVADAITVYLNGRYIAQSTTKRLMDGPRSFPHPANFDLPVQAGENVLAVLAKNWGCYRNTASYNVPLATASGWGILGNVALDGQPMGRWRQADGMAPRPELAWGPVKPLADPVRWYRTTFALPKHPACIATRLFVKGLTHGALWLNGQFAGLYSYAGHEAGYGSSLPTPWLRDHNELILLEEGGGQPAEGEVRFDRASTYVPVRIQFTPQPTAPANTPAPASEAPAPKARPKA